MDCSIPKILLFLHFLKNFSNFQIYSKINKRGFLKYFSCFYLKKFQKYHNLHLENQFQKFLKFFLKNKTPIGILFFFGLIFIFWRNNHGIFCIFWLVFATENKFHQKISHFIFKMRIFLRQAHKNRIHKIRGIWTGHHIFDFERIKTIDFSLNNPQRIADFLTAG